ncbi:MAG: 50S ribosomal protein L1 [Pseudomonadales bacterium]|nr:50S ribosomal protein L1 [Pseudomonadales bacterium]
MAGKSKRQKTIAEKIDKDKIYQINEAVELLNSLPKSKFTESMDVSVNLGVDPKKSDQVVRGATNLPHGVGKDVRVAVITQGENADKAREAGADLVGFEDLSEVIKSGEMDFDVLIATPDAMRLVGQLGRVLGPRGLMPNPKTGTVTPNVVAAINNAKAGQVQYRTDKAGIIHGSVGRVGFDPDHIRENIEALITDLKKAKPASAKGVYFQKVVLSTTMGPGISVDKGSLGI